MKQTTNSVIPSFGIDKDLTKKTFKTLDKKITYSPADYKISNSFTGAGVKIAIIDSGCPSHKDIKVSGDKISFCNNNRTTVDKMGHSTIVSGIINAKNKKVITGLAPNAKMYYAKVIDDQGNSSFNSLLSAILWAIVKEVDIITLALGTQYDYSIIHDAVQKARKNGICIFAAAGNDVKRNGVEVDYPADTFKMEKDFGKIIFEKFSIYLWENFCCIRGNTIPAFFS